LKNGNIVIIITSKDLLGLVFAAPKVDIVMNVEDRRREKLRGGTGE